MLRLRPQKHTHKVSARTDSFAFGVVTIELMTGLHPILVREIIDENLFEELPDKIIQFLR